MAKDNIKQIIQRIERLENAVFGNCHPDAQDKKDITAPTTEINFSLNERAFATRYMANKSGPKKFTLLLAYFAKGKVGENISLSDIRKHWNRMEAKTLLGKFNLFYPNAAKTRGWVDSRKYGTYSLTNEWEQVL
jgi:hypothetical protein